MSSAARGRKIWGWIGGQAQARNAVALTRCTGIRAAVLSSFLLSCPTAFVPAARADAFAAGSRAYAARNYVLAAQIFLPLAEQRDARAQTYLGVMYLRGQGVPQNFAVAAYWLQLASSAGLPTAQYFFGLMYDKGQGVAQDFVLAQAWLNLAVAHAEPRLAGPLGAHSRRGRLEDERGATRRGPATGVPMAARTDSGARLASLHPPIMQARIDAERQARLGRRA